MLKLICLKGIFVFRSFSNCSMVIVSSNKGTSSSRKPPMCAGITKEKLANLSSYNQTHNLSSVIPILTGHMWFLTSCHLRANLWSEVYLDLCKVIFRPKIYKPCLILSGPMRLKPKSRLMLKTKSCKNVPSSLEWLHDDWRVRLINQHEIYRMWCLHSGLIYASEIDRDFRNMSCRVSHPEHFLPTDLAFWSELALGPTN